MMYVYTGISEKWVNHYDEVQRLYHEGKILEKDYQTFMTRFNLSKVDFKNGKYYFYYRYQEYETMNSYQLVKLLMEK